MSFQRIAPGIILLIAISCIPCTTSAQINTLRPTGFVNDFAGIINDDTKSKLTGLLTSLEAATSIELAVVTVQSLDDIPVEDYATRLFEQWGIGKKGRDNGLLVLIAPNERKMRIEVGYDLEGAINDAVAGRIIRDTMIPWFKQGDFSTGILNGVVESINLLNTKYNLNFDPSKIIGGDIKLIHSRPEEGPSIFSTIIKIIAVLFIILLVIKNPWAALFLASTMGRGGSFGSGGFGGGGGGGFGGFGGGMSGGGGASGSW